MWYDTPMNESKVTDLDYINFLLAAPRVVSCTEAARVQPDAPNRAAHDVLTRLLHRLEFGYDALVAGSRTADRPPPVAC
jgi:hypothetical protein